MRFSWRRLLPLPLGERLGEEVRRSAISLAFGISRFGAVTVALATFGAHAQENIPLVDIKSVDPSIVVELRYATSNNLAGHPLYQPGTPALVRPEVAQRLAAAQALLKRYRYSLKIWDAYRPRSVQVELWKAAAENDYVANPYAGAGSLHSWGVAVDATLTDFHNRPVSMPTDYDNFTPGSDVDLSWSRSGHSRALASVAGHHARCRLPWPSQGVVAFHDRRLGENSAARRSEASGTSFRTSMARKPMIDILLRDLRQPEYIHVLLNPLPVYGLLIGWIGLLIAIFLRSRSALIATLAMILICAISAWPVFEFGEQAYDRVLSMSGDAGHAWLDEHMHRAEQFIFVFYALAILSAVAIAVPIKWPKTSAPLAIAVLLLGAVALGMGGYIAYAGGKIRHREFRNQPPPPLRPAEEHHD